MNSALAPAHNKNLAAILDFSPLTAHIKFVIKFCGLCFGNIQNPATSHFPHHLLDYYSSLLNGFFAFVLMPFGLFNTTAKVILWKCCIRSHLFSKLSNSSPLWPHLLWISLIHPTPDTGPLTRILFYPNSLYH